MQALALSKSILALFSIPQQACIFNQLPYYSIDACVSQEMTSKAKYTV